MGGFFFSGAVGGGELFDKIGRVGRCAGLFADGEVVDGGGVAAEVDEAELAAVEGQGGCACGAIGQGVAQVAVVVHVDDDARSVAGDAYPEVIAETDRHGVAVGAGPEFCF